MMAAHRRRKSESSPAYAAGAHYIDAGPLVRSLRATADHFGKDIRLIERWSRRHEWVARADAYDAEVAEDLRRKKIQAIEEMNDRHAGIAAAMQGKVIARLNTMTLPLDLSVGQLAIWMEKAATIERLARGEATTIVALPRDTAVAMFSCIAQSIARHVIDKKAIQAILNDMRGLLGNWEKAA